MPSLMTRHCQYFTASDVLISEFNRSFGLSVNETDAQ